MKGDLKYGQSEGVYALGNTILWKGMSSTHMTRLRISCILIKNE